jgi:hypothetical protein
MVVGDQQEQNGCEMGRKLYLPKRRTKEYALGLGFSIDLSPEIKSDFRGL